MMRIIQCFLMVCVRVAHSTTSWVQHKTIAKSKKNKTVQTIEVQSIGQLLNVHHYPQRFSNIRWDIRSIFNFACKEGYSEKFYHRQMNGKHTEIMEYYTPTLLAQYTNLIPYWHAKMWSHTNI